MATALSLNKSTIEEILIADLADIKVYPQGSVDFQCWQTYHKHLSLAAIKIASLKQLNINKRASLGNLADIKVYPQGSVDFQCWQTYHKHLSLAAIKIISITKRSS